MQWAFMRSGVSRNGGESGRNTERGCGSKVSNTSGASASRAKRRASPITAWWPRCTPSKFPTTTTAPRASGTTVSKWRKMRIGAVTSRTVRSGMIARAAGRMGSPSGARPAGARGRGPLGARGVA